MGAGGGCRVGKLVWSLGTSKAGRSLQTFVLLHYKVAVGVTPSSTLSHQIKPCLKVRIVDVDS